MNVHNFVKRLQKETEGFRRDEVRRVAMGILMGVSQETPVDTGNARANWHVQTGSASSDVDDYTGDASGAAQASISRGVPVIAGYDKQDKSIHITNNLPYIERLNNGYSAQAPRYFVETIIEKVVGA